MVWTDIPGRGVICKVFAVGICLGQMPGGRIRLQGVVVS